MKKIGILIFIATLILGVFAGSIFSWGKATQRFFSISFNEKVKGSGNVASERRDVNGFTGVDAGGIFTVEVTAGREYSVEVEADDNLLQHIRTRVSDGVLHISTTERVSTSNPMVVRISAPRIEELDASGVAKISLTGVEGGQLSLDSSGASKVKVAGSADRLLVDVSGASNIDASDLRVRSASVDASGAAKVSLNVAEELRADASGASRIVYSGQPANITKNTSGAGKVSDR